MLQRLFLLSVSVLFFSGVLFVGCSGEEVKKECDYNSDCKSNAKNCKSNKCVDIVCSANSDCRGGWTCDAASKKCIDKPPVECKTADDCRNDQTCNTEGKCVTKPECEKDTDCKDATKPQCKSNKCVEKTCTADADCADSKKICKDAKCIDKPVECTTHTDCKDPVKTECNAEGKCVEQTCTAHTDCKDASRPLCISGRCVPDDGKDVGEVCERGKIRCKNSLLCVLKDPQKDEGICSSLCNPLKSNCTGTKVCQPTTESDQGGACVDKKGGKGEGEECDKDACEVHLVCREWKGKKVCARPCDPKLQDCGSRLECFTFKGKEEKSFCVSQRDPCGIGRPCTNDYLCDNGFCNPPPSCDGIVCKDGFEVCDKGACREKRCPDELSCPTNSTCTASGACQYSQADPGCVACSTAQPCTGGDLCLSGFGAQGEAHCFQQNCTVGQPCNNANFVCRTINVTLNGVTCTSNTDCTRSNPSFAWVCNNGTCSTSPNLCVPTIGNCSNKCKGVTCQGRDVCVASTGSCVKPYKKLCEPCQHAEECGGEKDTCVTFTQGTVQSSYCGLDCSAGSNVCPAGYECATLQGGGKQCVPLSRKCPPTP